MRSTLPFAPSSGPPTINLATGGQPLASLEILDGDPNAITLESKGGTADVQQEVGRSNMYRCNVLPHSDGDTAKLYVPPGVRVGFSHISAIARSIQMDALASLRWGPANRRGSDDIELNVMKALGVHVDLTGYTVREFEVSDLHWGKDPAVPQYQGWSWTSGVSIERRVDPGDGDFERTATIGDPLSLGIGPWEVLMTGVARRGRAEWKATFGISESGRWHADTQHTTANVAWGRRSVSRAEVVGL